MSMVVDIKDAKLSAAAEVQAKNAADMLHKHYPGWLWGVHVDDVGGVMKVLLLSVSGSWGFVIKLKDLDPEYRMVMRAGGEILERFNLSRRARRLGDISNLQRDSLRRAQFHKD
jgi:hypothetical protein